MCDCVRHVCKNCCCNCSCTDINLWIVIIVGVLIAIGMFLCFLYFNSKRKEEYRIDEVILKLRDRSKKEGYW